MATKAKAERLLAVGQALSAALGRLRFSPPVGYVYDPLQYAQASHAQYLRRYLASPEVLLLGMNPGPFGMAQTGVPFGEVSAVREWLGLEAPVGRPTAEHPKRPVEGFACRRSEVSGARLWGWVRSRWGSPDAFFARFFVLNYCPLLFLEPSGRNVTPDKLQPEERRHLIELCDQALAEAVEVVQPRWVVGVGRFATQRAEQALAAQPVRIGTILHPSPASPLANRGWGEVVERQLQELGIALDGTP